MIALDTNVFVRFLVDTPDGGTEQVRRARELVSLRAVIDSAGFIAEDRPTAEAALDAWEAGKGDFADYLIRRRARALGAEPVYTFDGELLGDDGFAEP